MPAGCLTPRVTASGNPGRPGASGAQQGHLGWTGQLLSRGCVEGAERGGGPALVPVPRPGARNRPLGPPAPRPFTRQADGLSTARAPRPVPGAAFRRTQLSAPARARTGAGGLLVAPCSRCVEPPGRHASRGVTRMSGGGTPSAPSRWHAGPRPHLFSRGGSASVSLSRTPALSEARGAGVTGCVRPAPQSPGEGTCGWAVAWVWMAV